MSNGRNLLRLLRPRYVLVLIPGLKISIIIMLVGSLLFSLMLWHYLNIQDQWEFKQKQTILVLYIGLKLMSVYLYRIYGHTVYVIRNV